jgi:hypothetical protein
MKSPLLILAVAALVISSCTSAYKSRQTPDDVYFSPAQGGVAAGSDEYVRSEKNDDRRYRGSDEYYEDRYLRMRVQNRSRWSPLDDYYFNSPYAYNYNFYGYNSYSSWNNPYNSYWCWNNYYNPYYSGVVFIKNPKAYTPPPSRPVAFNGTSYKNPKSGNFRPSASRVSNSYSPTNSSRYNNRNSSSFGNTLRKVFTNNNNSSYQSGSNNSSTPSRSYNPSSSNSSSSSRSSSSSSGSSSSGSSGGGRPAR